MAPRGQCASDDEHGRRAAASYEEDKALIIERVGELAEYARSQGVVFGLEVHANTAVSTRDRVDEVLGAINSPFCRLDFDGSHFEVQLIPMEQVIPQVLPWTVAVDIKDQRVRYVGTSRCRMAGGSPATASTGRRPWTGARWSGSGWWAAKAAFSCPGSCGCCTSRAGPAPSATS